MPASSPKQRREAARSKAVAGSAFDAADVSTWLSTGGLSVTQELVILSLIHILLCFADLWTVLLKIMAGSWLVVAFGGIFTDGGNECFRSKRESTSG